MMQKIDEQPVKDGRERRRSPRVRITKQVVIRWKQSGNDLQKETPTVSLSAFGCAVQIPDPLPPGTSVAVEYNGKQVGGRVLYTLVNHTAGTVEMAIGFSGDAREFWEDVDF